MLEDQEGAHRTDMEDSEHSSTFRAAEYTPGRFSSRGPATFKTSGFTLLSQAVN
jgi:hypothetical protein